MTVKDEKINETETEIDNEEDSEEEPKIGVFVCHCGHNIAGTVDVAKVAAQFGGGGHKPAAGATIEGSLEETQAKVLEATNKILNGSSTKP